MGDVVDLTNLDLEVARWVAGQIEKRRKYIEGIRKLSGVAVLGYDADKIPHLVDVPRPPALPTPDELHRMVEDHDRRFAAAKAEVDANHSEAVAVAQRWHEAERARQAAEVARAHADLQVQVAADRAQQERERQERRRRSAYFARQDRARRGAYGPADR